MITIKSSVENYSLSLPNSPQEITAEYLQSVVNPINLAKNYAVIAVIRQVKLGQFVLALGDNKAKINAIDRAVICKVDAENIPNTWTVGQQIVISESDVAMANHITLPCAISYDNVVAYLEREHQRKMGNYKETLLSKITMGDLADENGVKLREYPICFVSFKIVPITNIRATVDKEIKFKDPFIKVESTDENSEEAQNNNADADK